MNDCVKGEIKEALPELVRGTLASAEVARVQEHLRACADCAAEVEILRVARSAMELAPVMDTTRIAAAVRASTGQRMVARRAPASIAQLAMVSLILTVGAIGIWAVRDSSTDAPVGTEGRVAARIPVPARGPVQLALGGDMSQLEDEQLVALMGELMAFEAMPVAEPTSLAIEPVLPVDMEEL